jgi:rhodanese-related sulfurtransferase
LIFWEFRFFILNNPVNPVLQEICGNLRNLRIQLSLMAEHARFEKLVAEAKKNIQEISAQDTAAALKRGDTLLIDVRDPDEWQESHIPGAKNFSRGTVELEIEEAAPDFSTLIITHCGGGGRSALAAESLQRMGYKNVKSMAGGFKAWRAAGLPTTKN